jgi:hypothetical protein
LAGGGSQVLASLAQFKIALADGWQDGYVLMGWLLVLLLPVVVLVAAEHLLQHLVIEVLELDHLRAPAASSSWLLPRRGGGVDVGVLREVEDGVGAAHGVGPGGLLGGVEGAEQHADAVPARVADLGGVLAPRAASHAAVVGAWVAVHGTDRARSCGRSRGNGPGAACFD